MEGKDQDITALQEKLIGALIGLARATENNEHLVQKSTNQAVREGLAVTFPNKHYEKGTIEDRIAMVVSEKKRMVPNCFTCASPCGRTEDYDIKKLQDAEENVRAVKLLILSGIRGLASAGYQDETVNSFLYKALYSLGMEDWGTEELLEIVVELAQVHLYCVENASGVNFSQCIDKQSSLCHND